MKTLKLISFYFELMMQFIVEITAVMNSLYVLRHRSLHQHQSLRRIMAATADFGVS